MIRKSRTSFRIGVLFVAAVLGLSGHLYAQTSTEAINSGTQWLLFARYGMGIWAFNAPPDPLQEEFTVDDYTKTYVRDTLEAVKALQAVNSPTTKYEPAIVWVEFFRFPSAEQIGQKAQILSKAGKDVSQAVHSLLNARNADGGFGGAKGYPSNVVDTAFALQSLSAVQYADTTVTNNAISYIISAQNTDGGFGFYQGKSSNIYMTAVVSSTLQQFSQTTSIATAINKATSYLISQQQTHGGFGSVYETAHAYIALVAVSTDATVLGNAVNYLTTTQSADGSWLQDPYSTALALRALYFSQNKPAPPPPAPTTGTVSGMVVDASTNQPLNAVSVTSGQLSATTNNSGNFSLSNISAGSQQITFSLTGYSTSTVTVNITAGSIINIGTIGLSVNPTTGIVQGIVTDASNGQPLSGATITVTGQATWMAATGANGSYKITDIIPGTVTISASKTGYYTVSGTGADGDKHLKL